MTSRKEIGEQRAARRAELAAHKLAERVAWLSKYGVRHPERVAARCFDNGMTQVHWHCVHGHLRDCPDPSNCGLVDKP